MQLLNKNSATRRRLAGLLRATLYLSCVGMVSSFFLARAARAQMEKSVERAGAALMAQLGPELLAQEQAFLFNGERVFFSAKTTERPVAEVLEELEAHCKDQTSPVVRELGLFPAEILPEGMDEKFRDPSTWLINRDRGVEGKAGQIACIAHRKDSQDLEQLLTRAVAFVESGEVSELGDARYFLAKETEEGKTQVLSLWTEGSFNLLKLFPLEGEAEGSDSSFAPRPPGATRIFTAEVAGRPYGARYYESNQSREELLAFYDRSMAQKGYKERRTAAEENLHDISRVYTKDGCAVFVIADREVEGKTPLTIVDIGAKGFVESTVQVK